MKGLVALMPDARYDLRSWAVDQQHGNVAAYAVFSATHTEEGGPLSADREDRPTPTTST